MHLRRLSCLFAGAVLSWVLGPGSAGAGSITYVGLGNSSDGALAAKAIFTTGDGVITVVLSNELATTLARSF